MREWSYAALAPIEQSVADAFAEGAVWSPDYYAQWRVRCGKEPDPLSAGRPSQPFQSEYIRALLEGEVTRAPDAICAIDSSGARFRGASFAENFDLRAVKFRKPLHFEDCQFAGDVILADARLGHVCFTRGRLANLNANRLEANNEFRFRGVNCVSVHLHSARIASSATFDNSNFEGVPREQDEASIDLADSIIGGHLSLKHITAAGETRLVGARIGTSIFLRDAKLSGAGVGRALHAAYTTVGNAVYLKPSFRADGDVVFRGAKIGAGVHCENVIITGELNFAIAEIGGSLFLECARLTSVPDDRRDDEAICDDDEECAPDAQPDAALTCWNAKIGANVFLSKAIAKGTVIFDMADIGGSVRAARARFDCPDRKSFICASATIGHSVFLEGVTAIGQVDFIHTKIGGRLVCTGGSFDSGEHRRREKPRALNCDGIQVDGNMFLDTPAKADDNTSCPAFEARGAVYLHGATIGGDLICRGGRFVNVEGASLVLSSSKIGGSVHLSKGFLSIGEVYCRGAAIAGNFHCQGGAFHDGITEASGPRERQARDAVDLEGATIDGCLFLTGIRRFRGRMDLQGAFARTFADDTSVWNANWHPGQTAPEASVAWLSPALAGKFELDEATLHCDGRFPRRRSSTLSCAKVRNDFDCVELDRFVFEAFSNDDRLADDDGKPEEEDGINTDTGWQARYALLERQPEEWLGADFRPQPFTQCAKVLRRIGDRKSAQHILYRRERGRLRHDKVRTLERWLRGFFFGLFAGYGYRAHRAFATMFILWLVGVGVFSAAYVNGDMKVASDTVLVSKRYTEKKPGELPLFYEPFKPLVYSLDAMVPIIDLAQKHVWIPRDVVEDRGPPRHLHELPDYLLVGPAIDRLEPALAWEWGVPWLPKVYYWVEIVMGWFLSTVMIASLSGLLGNPRED